MKRLILLLLSAVILFLSSCGGDMIPEDKTAYPADQNNGQLGILTSKIIYTPDLLVFTDSNHGPRMVYYDSRTDEVKNFCFDPLCDHRSYVNESCLSMFFGSFINACYSNNYIYILYHDWAFTLGETAINESGLYRIAIDGSEAKLVYQCAVSDLAYGCIRVWENTIVFTVPAESGKALVAYNTGTGKAETLSGRKPVIHNNFLLVNGRLYFRYAGENSTVSTDLHMQDEIKISDNPVTIAYGNYLYYTMNSYDDEGNVISRSFNRIDPVTLESTTVGAIDQNLGTYIGIFDGYIYYINDVKLFMPSNNPGMGSQNRSGGELYRMNLSTGETELFYKNTIFDILVAFMFCGDTYLYIRDFRGYRETGSYDCLVVKLCTDESGEMYTETLKLANK